MEVKIDLRKSLADNAAGYYEKSKKNKAKIAGARQALERTLHQMQELREADATAPERAIKKRASREKQRWYHKFRWFVSSDGLLVVGGRDATSNEVLIKKHMEKNDLVFHADVHGAPFFIVKTEGNDVPENTMIEAAEAAAAYSSAWKTGTGSCDVYAVEPEQVSKTAESGEYLTKGAFVIRGERKWFRNTPLKLAVGFVVGENVTVIGGPPNAVSGRAEYHVLVGVGDLKSGALAKEIKKSVLRKTGKEAGRMINEVDVSEIQGWIPGGGGCVLE